MTFNGNNVRPADRSNAVCSSDVRWPEPSLRRMTLTCYPMFSTPPAGVDRRRFEVVYSIHDAP